MLGNIFAPLAMKVAGGIAAALAVLLVIRTIRLGNAKADLANLRADIAEIARKAAEQARNADEAAHTTVAGEKASTDASEARAREAAGGSDDPLKAGMDSLRNRK